MSFCALLAFSIWKWMQLDYGDPDQAFLVMFYKDISCSGAGIDQPPCYLLFFFAFKCIVLAGSGSLFLICWSRKNKTRMSPAMVNSDLLKEETRVWVYLKHVNRNCCFDGCVCMTHTCAAWNFVALPICWRGCPVCHLSHQSTLWGAL